MLVPAVGNNYTIATAPAISFPVATGLNGHDLRGHRRYGLRVRSGRGEDEKQQ